MPVASSAARGRLPVEDLHSGQAGLLSGEDYARRAMLKPGLFGQERRSCDRRSRVRAGWRDIDVPIQPFSYRFGTEDGSG